MKGKKDIWNARLGSSKTPRAYRTECKLGQHGLYAGDEAEWLTNPMGLSCTACIERQRRAA